MPGTASISPRDLFPDLVAIGQPDDREDYAENRSNTKTTAKPPGHDWKRFESMGGARHRAAAVRDPEARLLAPDDFRRMKRTPQVKIIRCALGLSQEEFSARFHIPLGTLRDWEQGRNAPDAAARAYLVVIGRNPQAVRDALRAAPAGA